ncbi:MAG TPA: hypothetical protein VFB27_14830 [Opitutaceae bacterium]|nr:hypothetical protein [Opitutaceae bacterium]
MPTQWRVVLHPDPWVPNIHGRPWCYFIVCWGYRDAAGFPRGSSLIHSRN